MGTGGPHHVAVLGDFDAMAQNMMDFDIGMMQKFSDFPHLKQAFTIGQKRKVDGHKLQSLIDNKFLTEEEADKIREHGAIHSHLELIERNGHFKGFNQHAVNDIIIRTDARLH
jgi:hypothetical protein